jgi:hypothetical protein
MSEADWMRSEIERLKIARDKWKAKAEALEQLLRKTKAQAELEEFLESQR